MLNLPIGNLPFNKQEWSRGRAVFLGAISAEDGRGNQGQQGNMVLVKVDVEIKASAWYQ